MTPEPDAAERAAGDSLLRSGVWSTVSGFLPQIYVLVISVAAARILGPDEFGRQSFIAFVGLSVHMVLTAGLALALMRSVAEALGRREPERARGLVEWAWKVQTAAALLGGGILLAVALAGSSPSEAWALAGIATAIGIIQSVPNAALLGARRFRDAAVVGLVTGAVTVPATVGVLAAGGGIVGLFAVEAVVAAVNLLWVTALARRILRRIAPESRPAPDLQRAAMRFAGLTTADALVTFVVWRRSEFFFLAYYASDAQIGLYSIAFAVVTALAVLPQRLSVVGISTFATMRGEDDMTRLRIGFSRAMRLMILMMLPVVAGSIAVGPALLRLIYGDEYADVGPILVILLVALPILAMSTVCTALLSGLADARTPLIAGLAAAVVNVGLAFALIPGLDAVGAALANTGGQVAATVALLLFALRAAGGGVVWQIGSLLRALAASVAMGLAAWGIAQAVGGAAGVLLAVPAGAAVFVALAVGMRVLSSDDAAWVDSTLGHLLGGRVGGLVRRAAWRPGEVPA